MTQTGAVANPLRKSRIVVLDGGLGTEIERSYQKQLKGPLWSAEILCTDPHIIKSIHRAYLDAGADVISTSTYQASVAGFQKIGYSEKESKQILKNSIKLASEAKKEFLQANPSVVEKPCIALSLGAFGACLCDGNEFTGDYKGATDDEIYQFHMDRINTILQDNKYSNDAAILAFETIPRLQEAKVIAEILKHEKIVQGIPAWVSFYANSDNLLPDGNSVFDAVKLIASLNLNHTENAVCGVGFNCIQPGLLKPLINEASRCLNGLFVGEDSKKPVLISYPNSGEEYDADTKDWNGSSDLPDDMTNYSKVTQSWVNETNIGAIGGCCRTCPNHIRALSLHYKK